MPDPLRDFEIAREAIDQFLSSSREPALLEAGEPPIALKPENYSVEVRGGRLTLQAWDETRNVSRRIAAVVKSQPGRLELTVERFGKRMGAIELVDLARPRGQQASRHGQRTNYREQFRRSLRRQFPGWTVRDLSAEPDLENSLSPAYPRALLARGASGIAAIGASTAMTDPSGALTFGLIWLDYLRRREKGLSVEALAVFLPSGGERPACLRALHLDRARVNYRLFAYDDAWESEIDLRDHGNVDTEVRPNLAGSTSLPEWFARLAEMPEVDILTASDGSRSARVRGLEIAREQGGKVSFGLHTKEPASSSSGAEVQALAREVALRRTASQGGARGELYSRSPELWLESQVRRHLDTIDPLLVTAPVYGQVPAIAAMDRAVLDLLAVERGGRLAVLELKASEDPHLPLQAMDYWVRVNWHRERGEFTANGYFPGVELKRVPARMILIAPALEFHPTTETVLSYFSPSIEVERIGVNMNWRSGLRVAFRATGARSPQWEQEENSECRP